METSFLLLLLLSVLHVCVCGVADFRICAFNLQRFNSQKAKQFRVKRTLTQIMSRCDITLLQEVMDPDGKIVQSLLAYMNTDKVNRYKESSYKAESSKSLGSKKDNMQKYVFIYREQSVNVSNTFQYEKKDAFERPPYVVQFNCNLPALKQFSLVPLHTEADKAVQEMDRLYDVFTDVRNKWKDENVMFLGDFHAGCSHMKKKDKKKIRLFKPMFSWLIGDKVDTSATDQYSCPYDRIVVHGKGLLKSIYPHSAQVFNYGKHFKLSKSKQLDISDHLPVEVRLKSSAHFLLQAPPLLMSLLLLVQSALCV